MRELDLASLTSVRCCADSLLSTGLPLDGIIANAGLMAGPKAVTADGIEAQFETNFLGHFVLVNRVAGLLNSAGRVVMVSSAGHRRSDVDLEDLNFQQTPYNEYLAYGRSKTATILFAVEFDRRYRSRGIRAAAVHPGAIQTETVQKLMYHWVPARMQPLPLTTGRPCLKERQLRSGRGLSLQRMRSEQGIARIAMSLK